ncbi:hypothetical protein GCM10010485_39800 [Streptosporangium carneum]
MPVEFSSDAEAASCDRSPDAPSQAEPERILTMTAQPAAPAAPDVAWLPEPEASLPILPSTGIH